MRILVLGSGAREHAFAWKLGQEPGVAHVVCSPGNPGIARTQRTAPVDALDPEAVLRLVEEQRIDLTVVGAEAPLACGLADQFAAVGRRVVGPTRVAAQLETSKAFAKDFMRRHDVPTAHYRVCATADDALAAIGSGEFGDALVVKADGLAAGKGVVVAPDRQTAKDAVNAAMVGRAFGDAGARVVLEELLTGPEVSFFVIADGERYLPLLSAEDHKRIFDGDRGPNTGGMGAFAPSPLMSAALHARVEREIVQPVLRGMAAEGTPFRGFLYCGLMLSPDGPKVIEFNVRFGDPEAQAVLPMLQQPLAPLLWDAANGYLRHATSASAAVPLDFVDAARSSRSGNPGMSESSAAVVSPSGPSVAVGVVLAAHGYPGDVRSGDVIDGLDLVAAECPGALVFFSGVKEREGALVTAGGRVLTIVGQGATFESAVACAYDAVSRVTFKGMQYRRDIGKKALDHRLID